MRLIALFAVLAVASSAAAQSEANPREEARRMVIRSQGHYNAGRFVTAADILDEAYDVYPEPTILLNAARAYDGAGRLDEAIDRYERFLASGAEVGHRGRIEARLQTLLEQREALARESGEPSAEPVGSAATGDPVEPATGSGPSVDPGPWIVFGAGAAVIVIGAVLGAVAQSSYAEAETEPSYRRAAELQQSAFDLATGANVAFIAGAAIATAGVIWAIVSLAAGGDEASARRPGVVRF